MSLAQASRLATLAVPLAMLCLCASPRARARMIDWLALAPVPGLLAAILAGGEPMLVMDEQRLRFTLALDAPGRMLLGASALLWTASGAYASAYLREGAHAGRFALCWLLTLTGSLGVFIAADLASFYAAFTIGSLAAYGLVVHDGTDRARRAGAIYLVLAVVSELLLLVAFALLASASPGDSLAIGDVVAHLPASPWRGMTTGLLIAGFGLKAGLVPLHVWLPIAHPAAPMPASAVLSGAIIKAGVIGLIRFLPFDPALADWGAILAAFGFLTAFYGVAVGLTQDNPKTVLAYSSASQMGVVAAALGMALASGEGSGGMATAFYATHHALVKGTLFLAVGVVAACGARQLWPILVPVGVLALGFGGLPLTGGSLAKLAVKETIGEGIAGHLVTLSTIASTVLMAHFLRRLAATTGPDRAAPPPGLVLPWLAMAVASIAVPWALFGSAGIGRVADALSPEALWTALWPVLLGLLVSLALSRSRLALPHVPEGDGVVLAERAARAMLAWAGPLERAERAVRSWPVAGLSLLVIALLLAGVLLLSNPPP